MRPIAALRERLKAVVALESQGPERPSAPRRTKQVLEAAEACFRENGFHATSMAQIASRARMSVGHIYRYFPGKNDIIAAIVTRDVHATVADFDAAQENAEEVFPAFYRYWRAKFEWMGDRSRSCLWLEILAESARNPEAAQVVREARARVAERMCALIEAGAKGAWTAGEVGEKVELLMMMSDAAAFRTISDPHYDPARAADNFLRFARCLFEQD